MAEQNGTGMSALFKIVVISLKFLKLNKQE